MSKRKSNEEPPMTRKRARLSEYIGRGNIQDLPTEVLWKIVDYLDDTCLLNLRDICNSFTKTLTVMFYHRYNTIPCKIASVRKQLYRRLFSSPLGDEEKRLDITKSILYLDWLENELVTFAAILRRYNVKAESAIFNQLWVVLNEVVNRLNSLTKSVPFSEYLADVRVMNPSTTLPHWSRFMEKFDEELEPALGKHLPFATRAIDILSCCPSSNTNVVVKHSPNVQAADVRAFFQIQDSDYRSIQGSTDKELETAILQYLRFMVRTKNSLFITNIYEEISHLECRLISNFLNSDERGRVITVLEEKYRCLAKSFYKPLMPSDNKSGVKNLIRRSTYNVPNNFMECCLQKSNLKPEEMPLIATYPQMFKVVKKEHSTRTSTDNRRPSNEMCRNSEEESFKLTIINKRWWRGDMRLYTIEKSPCPSSSNTSFTIIEKTELFYSANEE